MGAESDNDKLKEYIDGLNKLDTQLINITQQFSQLVSYKELKTVAPNGLSDIESFKQKTIQLKEAFDYAAISEQNNGPSFNNAPATEINEKTVKQDKVPYQKLKRANFDQIEVKSTQDISNLLETIIPTYTGIKSYKYERNAIFVELTNDLVALVSLSDLDYTVTRVNFQSSKETKSKPDYFVSEYHLCQKLTAVSTTDLMSCNITHALSTLNSYAVMLFKEPCYVCNKVISHNSEFFPPSRNIYVEDDDKPHWISLHTTCS
ncbi:hypothetical protein E3Q22_02208 [Wallemia mellicola]|uniref:Mediator complex subunit 27 n=2 Tax=Wallemia mellicola TaxID=1708541 RepID=A0A4T0N0K5_9BASI|nr:hypothetical protein WALSEDRAFT_58253 [Wallemia mellicola CBS 633.66]TIB77472.1 hypothetical protein E3Q23_01300 [Wallemia mellicola]EIM20196.1 hypothetical protein WALSEDRAFT_58253 [Wallemia mellicola CBS 633.66]TIB79881.1 hypothetical protein E3Q22_02208 [Wallemia mellicola]TIB86903.1 hypothetical protein E3Q21_01554 [Wallemia mellicola]TIB89754.1 hypothetical protein E3Q20_01470 [Wallemia mellicola]|eukprot:XP_006959684.1 hypothetical protein WALSEDRAFT_58253 [Wallemia mellicola CBS 633.66]